MTQHPQDMSVRSGMEPTPELEAMAFAIFCAGGFHPSDVANGAAAKMWASEEWPESSRKARRQARAALMAIYEPSEAMVWAALDMADTLGPLGPTATLQAMIDHILGSAE